MRTPQEGRRQKYATYQVYVKIRREKPFKYAFCILPDLFNRLKAKTYPTYFFLLFFESLLFSSFWTSCGLRCRPFSPRYVPSIFVAHRVQHSHRSSTFIETHAFALSASQLVYEKSPYEFKYLVHEYALGGIRTHAIDLHITGTGITCHHRGDRYGY